MTRAAKMPAVHPAANEFPMLGQERLEELAEDIAENGQREPCVMWNGYLLDGRNRWKACQMVNVEPKIREHRGDEESAIRLIGSLNLKRRDLLDIQRAYAAMALLKRRQKLSEEKAKEAGKLGAPYGAEGGRGRKKPPAGRSDGGGFSGRKTRTDHSSKAIKETSKETGLSSRILRDANQATRDKPDVVGAIIGGFVRNATEAKKLSKLSDREREKAIKDVTTGAAKNLSAAIFDITKDNVAKQTAAEVARSAEKAIVRNQNAIDFITSLKVGSVDLLLTDPPYSTDVKDIATFVRWLRPALALLKPTGRAYVFVGAYPQELCAYLNEAAEEERIQLQQVLVWTYRNTLGPTPKTRYKVNWQAILYFEGPNAPALVAPIMLEQFAVQDVSAPDGRLGTRLHEWQKPDELAERFVRHATKPGDLVVDPFAGSGTFLLAAAKLGRKALGCDTDEAALRIATRRGCTLARTTEVAP